MLSYLQKQSPRWLQALGLTFIALLAVFDYLTGPQLSFSIFYLLPISMIAWFCGRRASIRSSLIAAAAWLAADLLGGQAYFHPAVPFWNAIVRLGFFLIVTVALSTLREAQNRQDALQQFIVHDLRAPLSNVMTGLHLLEETLAGADRPDEVLLVQMSQMSTERLMALINALLDLSRLERGQLPLQPAVIQVGELLQQSVRDVTLWAGQKDLTLVIAGGAETALAWADPTVIGRVLTNILGNAVKFSPRGGVVTLATRSTDDGMLAISVTDEGDGVPAAWAERVFDKYAQIDARRQEAVTGFGLGLAFCRLAVEAQGGTIWLESPPDAGTTVIFTLPLQPPGRHPRRRKLLLAGRGQAAY